MAVEENLRGILAPLENELRTLEEEQEKLSEERSEALTAFEIRLKALGKEMTRIRRILRTAFPEQYSTQAKPKRQKTLRKARGVTMDRLNSIRAFVIDYLSEHDTVTQTEVRANLGTSSGDTAVAFRMLRAGYEDDEGDYHEGIIRQSGQKGNLKFFKLTKNAERELIDAHS